MTSNVSPRAASRAKRGELAQRASDPKGDAGYPGVERTSEI
jgi:hypothetical protein